MTKKIGIIFITVASFILTAACRIGTGLNGETGELPYFVEPAETFYDADRPVYLDIENEVENYRLLTPWNYDKGYNSAREYPLVVSLHGSGGNHYAPCIVNDTQEMKDHPCFFLSPTCSNWGSDAAWVRTLIETLKTTYRIDENRIYLMGFSMGGSGSYTFAKAYYNEKGKLFAGIVRLAGQSETELPPAIASKTSVWYQIGLNDTDSGRVTIAEQAYQFLKSFSGNKAAVEYIVSDQLFTYPRKTKSLVLNGIAIVKKSEYTGMGHDGGTCFGDPDVLDWLFSQSLINR